MQNCAILYSMHKTSIAYGKEGMDIFAHTKLRDEYNEIVGKNEPASN